MNHLQAGIDLMRSAEKEIRGEKHPMRTVAPEWLLMLAHGHFRQHQDQLSQEGQPWVKQPRC
jgi:hypothetical protein